MKQLNDLEVNESNLDEFMYKHYGETDRNIFWRFYMKAKWKIDEFKMKFHRSTETRKFLHVDLQAIKNVGTRKLRLRYLDSNGKLVSRMFKVRGGYIFRIEDIPGQVSKLEKGPKGPLTYKETQFASFTYGWLGMRRYKTWWIYHSKLI